MLTSKIVALTAFECKSQEEPTNRYQILASFSRQTSEFPFLFLLKSKHCKMWIIMILHNILDWTEHVFLKCSDGQIQFSRTKSDDMVDFPIFCRKFYDPLLRMLKRINKFANKLCAMSEIEIKANPSLLLRYSARTTKYVEINSEKISRKR